MANGQTLDQIRQLVNSKSISTDVALPLILAGIADVIEKQNKAEVERVKAQQERERMGDRLTNIERIFWPVVLLTLTTVAIAVLSLVVNAQ